jgi:hypothetical protein
MIEKTSLINAIKRRAYIVKSIDSDNSKTDFSDSLIIINETITTARLVLVSLTTDRLSITSLCIQNHSN